MAINVIYLKTAIIKTITNEIPEGTNRQRPRNLKIEMLQDAHECFQNMIIDIDKEIAISPINELTNTLEHIRG